MKKILLLFVAMICAVAGWAQQATVSATVKGEQLEVALTNPSEDFVAFQMDITLPEGVSVNANGAVALVADRLTQPGTPSAIDANETVDFVVAYNVLNATTVRVIAYNLENRAIAGKEGALFNMTFTGTPADNFIVDNILFVTTSNLNEIKLALAESTADSVLIGDVNRDTKVNALDLTALLNIVLNKLNGDENYDLEAANVNGDDKINALDLTALLNITLGK